MAEKSLGGKSKREIAREKKQKAELVDKKKAEARKKVYKAPTHTLLVSKRAKKLARNPSESDKGKKKGQNCQRHLLKDLLCKARGYKDRDYPEANFRVDGSGILKPATAWAKHNAV